MNTRSCQLLPASGDAKSSARCSSLKRSEQWTLHETPRAPALGFCATRRPAQPNPLSNGGWSGRGVVERCSACLERAAPLRGLASLLSIETSRIGFTGVNPAIYKFSRLGYEPEHETLWRAVARLLRLAGAIEEHSVGSEIETISSAHQSPVAVSEAMKKSTRVFAWFLHGAIAPAACRFGRSFPDKGGRPER
jgi:hypothetical protein